MRKLHTRPDTASPASTTCIVRVLPTATTDEALAHALRARSPGAAELLIARYGTYVERLIVRVIGIDPDVPDLIQEVVARALEGAHRIREHAALKGWIGSVTIFTARTFLRDRRSRRYRMRLSAPDELPDRAAPIALPEVTQTLARTYAALDTLPERERVVFALRFIDEMDLSEIATICRVSLATAKRRIARAQRLFEHAARQDPLLREQLQLEEFAREVRA
jgi:RNA polymerase sigma-70 factor (ECF subfamily)